MSTQTNRIDSFVADLAHVRDDELVAEVRSSEARALLATILDTPGEAPSEQTTSRSTGGRRIRLIALAAAVALAAVLSVPALGVVRDVVSYFAGWHDPDVPVPTASDVVIASGEAGVPWRLLATTSDQGLCLGLVHGDVGAASCGYRDIRGDLPPDVRGDPNSKCVASPTKLVPCGSLPLHWIGPFGAGGGSSGLNRTFAFGPLAAEVESVELLLTNGDTVRAHVVERPEGLDAPLNFYWAAWPCGSSQCAGRGPQVAMGIARDSAGGVLERRVPIWNGNPTGDPSSRLHAHAGFRAR